MATDDSVPTFRKPLLTRRGRAFALATIALVSAFVFHEWWTAIRMPGRSFAGPLPAVDAEGRALRDRLRAHVSRLASGIGARSSADATGLDEARSYVASELAALGYAVTNEAYEVRGVRYANVVAERPGTGEPESIVVVGAHYDAIALRPGANDNASGTAALLELARVFATQRVRCTLRFVAFTNEEPPHFQTEAMGSLVDARRARARGDDVVAMLSLESLGHCRGGGGGSRRTVRTSTRRPRFVQDRDAWCTRRP